MEDARESRRREGTDRRIRLMERDAFMDHQPRGCHTKSGRSRELLRRGMNKRHPGSFRNSCRHDSELVLLLHAKSYKSRPNGRTSAGAVIVGLLPAFFCVVGQNARLRTTLLTSAHATGLARSSKSLFPALVQCHLSVWKRRRLPRQLDDRLSLLAAIRERHEEKAFIALLHDLDTGCGLRHGPKNSIRQGQFLPPGARSQRNRDRPIR
jgi:hypothetical protein